jgi:hypothetical protein
MKKIKTSLTRIYLKDLFRLKLLQVEHSLTSAEILTKLLDFAETSKELVWKKKQL